MTATSSPTSSSRCAIRPASARRSATPGRRCSPSRASAGPDDLALSGAELASIGAPVLLVHGRDDRVVPWRVSSAQLIDLLPDARLHVISGCGHWTMIEKTADFLAVVQPFLSPDQPPAGTRGR